ncbi:hypothetical protein GCM10027053_47380 [Intrasporangium mesophilum]
MLEVTADDIGAATDQLRREEQRAELFDIGSVAMMLAARRPGPMCTDHAGRWGADASCTTCSDDHGQPRDMPNDINPAHGT